MSSPVITTVEEFGKYELQFKELAPEIVAVVAILVKVDKQFTVGLVEQQVWVETIAVLVLEQNGF